MSNAPTPLTDSTYFRWAVTGILVGIVVFAVLTGIMFSIVWPGQPLSAVIFVALFGGIWGGPFFGGAAAIGVLHLQAEADSNRGEKSRAPARRENNNARPTAAAH